MKIAFLTPSISRTAGGIFEIERRLAQSLADLPDMSMEVYGAEDKCTCADLPQWFPLEPKFYPFIGPQNFRYSSQLRREFVKCDADVAHLHALWMHTSLILLAWARRHRRPYIITANGMLDPWALKNSRIKKQIVGAIYERRCLDGATCIQVNSERELESVRNFGLRNPVCIIPNGVDVRPPPAKVAPGWSSSVPIGADVLLYLGRLHPKKNLPTLLRAWKRTSENPLAENWYLVVAGWEQLGHASQLKQLVTELGVDRVCFLGAQFDDEKTAAFHAASAIVLPSLSEGLPMTVLEAWAAAKPVLMTPECNLPEGFAQNAALRIRTDVDGTVAGLNELFAMSVADRQLMGQRGLSLVQKDFSWSNVAGELRSVYQWCIAGGPRPNCVIGK